MIILKGLRFGLLLQIAIGPVFLYILKTALESGILAAESAVVAVTLVDAIFVSLAILGIGTFLDKPGTKRILNYFGALVLACFGIAIMLAGFGINILPAFWEAPAMKNSGPFVTGLILTASSPLTLLFWTGVFASKLSGEGYSKTEMKLFGSGAIFATPLFLGLAALVAGLLHPLTTPDAINFLNIIVGVALILFALKLGLKKCRL